MRSALERALPPIPSIVLAMLSAGLAVLAGEFWNRPPSCFYPGHYSAADAMRWLIQREGQAVLARDTAAIERLYGEHAQISDGSRNDPGRRARAHYAKLFAANDYVVVAHHSFSDPFLQEDAGRMTTGSYVVYRTGNGAWTPQWNREASDHWSFGKQIDGCWVITRLEYNASHKPFIP